MKDLVTIVVPSKNRETLIAKTLDSVAAQTYGNWECLVIDDGSTDGTPSIGAAFAARDPRFKFLRNESGRHNANVCRNIGVDKANGDYVIFLDSDDLLMPLCAERRVEAIKRRPDLDFVSFFAERFRERPGDVGNLWGHPSDEDSIDRFLKFTHPIQTTGPIFRIEFLRRAENAWLESLPRWQDWEFLLRLILNGARFEIVAAVDYYYRLAGPDSICSAEYRPEVAISLSRHLADIAQRLHRENQFTEKRRISLSLLFLSLIEEMMHIRNYSAGRSILQSYLAAKVGPKKLAKLISQFVRFRSNPILRPLSYYQVYPKIAMYKHRNSSSGRLPSNALARADGVHAFVIR